MIVVAFVGAAIGGTLVRWRLGVTLPPPIGTLVANLAGAFALGWAAGASAASQTVVGVAALGSLTTFSTLVIEILELVRDRPRHACAYALVTAVGGVAAAWAGLRLA